MEKQKKAKRVIYTTRTGAKLVGLSPTTLRHCAVKYGYGRQPGGKGSPHIFTVDDLKKVLQRYKKRVKAEAKEDRAKLGLGPMFKPDPYLNQHKK